MRLDDYLSHIIDAIHRIDVYTADLTEAIFLADTKTQDAVFRNFEVIGEAYNNVLKKYSEFATANPDIPWKLAYDMRNTLVHAYHKVDVELVWITIQHNLNDFLAQIEAVKKTLPEN